MIGIDLVDLKQAELDSNWRRKGYLNKIFTPHEQEMIRDHEDPNLMVWLLWSMKEAAYKIWSRNTGLRIYAPASICCDHIHFGKSIYGDVTHLDQYYFTQSNLNEDYICTIATSEKSKLASIKVNLSPSNSAYDHSAFVQSRSHHGRYLATASL